MKQGCSLSPILFSIYINDLVEQLHQGELGVDLGNEVLSVLAFADDILCLSRTSREGTETQMKTIVDWCTLWKMKMSEPKTYIATLSSENNWVCEGENDYLSFEESLGFSYLGMDYRLKGRDFLGDHYEKMKKKADKYVYAILNLTRDLLDRSVVARSLWEYCAVPAIMYGLEACIVSKGVLRVLEEKQKAIAAFVTGLPRNGGNVALTLESGLLPMQARYDVGVHRFFNRLLESNSDLICEALQEHRSARWGSPYRSLLRRVIRKYGLANLNSEASKSRITGLVWRETVKEMYDKKSLKFYSVRNKEWELPSHVNDSEHSTVLCKVRTGNGGLGNRCPLEGMSVSLKECPFCKDRGVIRNLSEEHVLLFCPGLGDIQQKYGFKTYMGKMMGQDRVLWRFLGGDRCSWVELLQRGRMLQSFLMEYRIRVYQTRSVSLLLSR